MSIDRGPNRLLNLLVQCYLSGTLRLLMLRGKMARSLQLSSIYLMRLSEWCVKLDIAPYCTSTHIFIDRNPSNSLRDSTAFAERLEHFDRREESISLSFQFATLSYSVDSRHSSGHV